jgi:hypothetical protein
VGEPDSFKSAIIDRECGAVGNVESEEFGAKKTVDVFTA